MKKKILVVLAAIWALCLVFLIILKWRTFMIAAPIFGASFFGYLIYATFEGSRKNSLTEVVKEINKKQKEKKK